jgi:hypothetical protein
VREIRTLRLTWFSLMTWIRTLLLIMMVEQTDPGLKL